MAVCSSVFLPALVETSCLFKGHTDNIFKQTNHALKIIHPQSFFRIVLFISVFFCFLTFGSSFLYCLSFTQLALAKSTLASQVCDVKQCNKLEEADDWNNSIVVACTQGGKRGDKMLHQHVTINTFNLSQTTLILCFKRLDYLCFSKIL